MAMEMGNQEITEGFAVIINCASLASDTAKQFFFVFQI